MSNLESILDCKVAPYSGGRMNTDTATWPDATELEITQHYEIDKLEKKVNTLIDHMGEVADIVNSCTDKRLITIVNSCIEEINKIEQGYE